ncbi:MAG: hypothetical protein OEW15_07135 [Nitrospirota bacterium]|nr:hypothetical protein [Nitrospirota bacterium]
MLRNLAPMNIGIEITARVIRFGIVSSRRGTLSVPLARTRELPAGTLSETFGPQAILDRDGLAIALREGLVEFAAFKTRRIAISLPDGMFRVQTLEFDELPANARDREKLIRWRLEKSAAFDLADTVLRYQVQERPERGSIVLASVAQRALISQVEEMLFSLGYDVWSLGLSSFHAVNFYAPVLSSHSGGNYALAWISPDSYTTIIMEGDVPRFYRFREIKSGQPGALVGRMTREIDDSLHFYTHRDRQQQSQIGRLYVSGDPVLTGELSASLRGTAPVEVEALDPSSVFASLGAADGPLAPVFGGGIA